MRPLDAETARFASVRWVPPPVSTPPLAATPSDDHPRDRQPAPGEEAVEKAAEAVPVGGASRSTIDLDEPAPLGEGLVLLVVDDNPFDLALIEELADELGPLAITVLHAPTLVDGMARARAGPVDVVLLNLDLPDSSGLATMVEWQLQPGRKVPIVALVEHGETDLIRGAKAAGAKQVVQKRHLTQLAEDPVTGSRRLEQLLRRASGTLVSPG
jgi:CheY-like chemotaxis protein